MIEKKENSIEEIGSKRQKKTFLIQIAFLHFVVSGHQGETRDREEGK